MIRFLLKLSIPLIIAFTTFSIAARALGTTQPPNPALAGFTEGCEDKPQPCWYGIVPGVTTLEEGTRIIKDLGYMIEEDDIYRLFQSELKSPHYIYMYTGQDFQNATPIDRLILDYYYPSAAIEVGSITALLGMPKYVVYTHDPIGLGFAYDNVYFGNDDDFHLRTSITFIGIEAHTVSSNTQLTIPWHGYAPRWRYCQLDPDFIFCNY